MTSALAKFACGERHRAEYVAGIILLNGGAFLFGDAILGCGNEILCGTNDSYHREDSERNGQILAALPLVKAKRRIEAICYRMRELPILAAATAAALGRLFKDFRSEKNGINGLNDCGWHILFAAIGLGAAAKMIAGIAPEDLCLALTTVKNHALFKHCNTFKLLRSAAADASLKGQLDIKAYVDGIKASVKLNGINGNVRGNNGCTLCADRPRMLQHLVAEFGKVDAYSFKAIAITTGIHYTACINANRITSAAGGSTGESVFCHNSIPP